MSTPTETRPSRGVHVRADEALLDEYEVLVNKRAVRQVEHIQELTNLDRQIAVLRDGLRSVMKPNVERQLPTHVTNNVTVLPEQVDVQARRKLGRPAGSKSKKKPAQTTLSRASLIAAVMAKLAEGDNRVRTSLEPIVTFLANEAGHRATVAEITEAIGLNREACRLRCIRGVKVGVLKKIDGGTYGLRK